MKDLAMGVAIAAVGFSVFVLVPFGLAWALGKLLGAG
jgi:hypothetical protein